MLAAPTVGMGTGRTVPRKGRSTEFFLSKTGKVSLFQKEGLNRNDSPGTKHSGRADRRAQRGGVGIGILMPGRRADRWGWTKVTIFGIIRTEGVRVSPMRSCYPRQHTSSFFGTPIDFFFKSVLPSIYFRDRENRGE